jgi:hypothetical protein
MRGLNGRPQRAVTPALAESQQQGVWTSNPASWLRQEGNGGLSAFIRKGCLDRPDGEVKPVPAGALLADQAMVAALGAPGADAFAVLPDVMKSLTAQARLVPGDAPRTGSQTQLAGPSPTSPPQPARPNHLRRHMTATDHPVNLLDIPLLSTVELLRPEKHHRRTADQPNQSL